MDQLCYVSQIVKDGDRVGGLHFTTPLIAKARSEVAKDPAVRFLFVFEDGVLVQSTADAPEHLRASAVRKEAQRRKLEAQAAAAESAG